MEAKMYLKKTSILLIAIFACMTAFSQIKSINQISTEAKSQVEQISVDELKMKNDLEDKFLLIDVRTEKEFLAAHIEGAIWIPRGKLEFIIQSFTKNPESEIILYCRTGTRSALSVTALNNIGYERVKYLDDGFKKWVEDGNSVFNMHGEIKVVNFEKKERE